MTPIQIKICGVTNAKDARACTELGASMVGFNFYPRSPRYIEPKAVRQIVDALAPGICAVGIFVDARAREIRKAAELAAVRCVQLHGDTSPKTCSELTREFRVFQLMRDSSQKTPRGSPIVMCSSMHITPISAVVPARHAIGLPRERHCRSPDS